MFGPCPTLEGKRPTVIVESFTEPDRLPTVMAIEVGVDAHILWTQNIRSPAEMTQRPLWTLDGYGGKMRHSSGTHALPGFPICQFGDSLRQLLRYICRNLQP